ncbi:hypothetical protein BKA93DRAFT_29005 [Sparassis latifolia]
MIGCFTLLVCRCLMHLYFLLSHCCILPLHAITISAFLETLAVAILVHVDLSRSSMGSQSLDMAAGDHARRHARLHTSRRWSKTLGVSAWLRRGSGHMNLPHLSTRALYIPISREIRDPDCGLGVVRHGSVSATERCCCASGYDWNIGSCVTHNCVSARQCKW